MSQQPAEGRDRRAEGRVPVAFAFWFTRPARAERSAAWMVNLSDGGAAFLCPADEAPALGEHVEIAEMFSVDAHVRESAPTLPPLAKVLRIESPKDAMRQVAVRFAERRPALLTPLRQARATQARLMPLDPATPIIPIDSASQLVRRTDRVSAWGGTGMLPAVADGQDARSTSN